MDAITSTIPLLYLCRHGQTDWNAEGRIQGQRDIPLNDIGRAQARRNGRYLRNVLSERAAGLEFLASPMARAVETMRIIRAEIGLAPDDFPRDERLMELHFGDWQGWTLAEIADRDPGSIERREADKWDFLPPGASAERYEDLARRIRPVFDGLSPDTIVVAHGGVTRTFMHLYLGVSPQEAAHTSIVQDRILRTRRGGYDWV